MERATQSRSWRPAMDDRLGPHFARQEGESTILLYLDGVEWTLRVETPGVRPVSAVQTLHNVVEVVPEFFDEAVGMTRAAMHREAANVRERLVAALAALDADDYSLANELVDDLRAWPAGHAQDDLREVGAE